MDLDWLRNRAKGAAIIRHEPGGHVRAANLDSVQPNDEPVVSGDLHHDRAAGRRIGYHERLAQKDAGVNVHHVAEHSPGDWPAVVKGRLRGCGSVVERRGRDGPGSVVESRLTPGRRVRRRGLREAFEEFPSRIGSAENHIRSHHQWEQERAH